MCPDGKAKTTRKGRGPSESPIPIRPVNIDGLERIYANHVRISNTNLDFTLTFCDIQAPSEIPEVQEKFDDTGVLEAPIVCRVVLPVELIPDLIKALRDNFETFDKHRKEMEASKEEEY